MAEESIDLPLQSLQHNDVDVRTASKEDVLAVLQELRAASIQMERISFMRRAGVTYNGDRDLYTTLGYDEIITDKQYRARYARGGLAGRVVDALPKATWRGGFQLVEDEDADNNTAFEIEWEKFSTRLKVTPRLQRLDILSGLSSFAGLFISAPGELNTELPKGDGTTEAIRKLMPFSGGGGPQWQNKTQRSVALDADLVVETWDKDPNSIRFGEPLTYRLKRVDFDIPQMQVPVHWSRIIHVAAEDVLDDEAFGSPALERVWNLFDDLDKVTGGGAEAFWLRANQGMNVNIDKDHDIGDVGSPERIALADEVEKYRHNISRVMKTQGVEVKTLGSDVADFGKPADTIITQIAGAKAIPKRILTGSEMGELASSQDRENWRDQVVGRRNSHADPFIVRVLVDRLIDYNYLVRTKKDSPYIVRFAAITTMTEEEKADGAKKWAETNSTAGQPIYTADQIRDYWYDFAPLTKEETAKEKEATKPEEPPVVPGAAKPVARPRAAEAAPAPSVQVHNHLPAAPAPAAAPIIMPLVREDEQELLNVLTAAIEANNTDVIDAIIGVDRMLGGPGSGNHGHSGGAGGPGNPGGSGSKGDGAPRDVIEHLTDRIRKNTLAWQEETGNTRQAMADRVHLMYLRATDQQKSDGDEWYPKANAEAARMAQEYGLTTAQAAGVIASLSPLREWGANLTDAQAVIRSIVKGEASPEIEKLFRANVNKAVEIINGANPETVLWKGEAGFKVRSFYENIVNPASREATIDTHMLRILLDDNSITSKVHGMYAANAGRYAAFRQAILDVADRTGVLPAAVQATVWVVQKAEHPKRSEIGGNYLKAAETNQMNDARTLAILLDAVKALFPDVDVKTLGGPGSGNFGHAGRPGEVGGSAPADSGSGSGGSGGKGALWKSAGGWEHTGITWKQETDPKTGRAIPIKVNTVEEAAALVLDGKVVEVKDVREAHTLIANLAKMAQEAKAAGKEAKDYDLCQVTVKGSSIFCAESLRNEQYPNGVPRIEMPQLGGNPVPGSEADKLERSDVAKNEVDGSKQFITHLQGLGVTTTREQVPASNLRASQRELVGQNVGGMMTSTTYDPAKNPIFISADNYVVDGHHRWAAVVGKDAADGKLGELNMNVIRVNAPISEVLHLANAWSTKFGIAQKAAVKKQAAATGLTK